MNTGWISRTLKNSFEGDAIDIDEFGALIIRKDNGKIERVIAGDCYPPAEQATLLSSTTIFLMVDDVWGSQAITHVAYSAAFIGLITLGGWISIPFFPRLYPPDLFCPARGSGHEAYAVIPVALYVILGALGLPVSITASGVGVLLGPTGGYLIGFIPAALVTGFAYESVSAWSASAGLAAACS